MSELGPYLLGPDDTHEGGIFEGDAQELAKAIPDDSVDLIFTDPPYARQYLSLYGWLARMARRTLRPGGSLLTYCGHAYLPEVLELMLPHLDYYWINCQYQPPPPMIKFWPRKIFIRWKPILWLVKGPRTSKFFVQDGIISQSNDKRFHDWGQPENPALHWMQQIALRLNDPIILDPLCGGGTIPAVCKALDLRYLAFEIEGDAVRIARERVGGV